MSGLCARCGHPESGHEFAGCHRPQWARPCSCRSYFEHTTPPPGALVFWPTTPDNQGTGATVTDLADCLDEMRAPHQINRDALAGIAAWLTATDAGLTTDESTDQ